MVRSFIHFIATTLSHEIFIIAHIRVGMLVWLKRGPMPGDPNTQSCCSLGAQIRVG